MTPPGSEERDTPASPSAAKGPRKLHALSDAEPAPFLKPPPNNLPLTRSSFVGREREVLEITRALAATRLLTLTGAGGAGKTRLALEVARNLAGAYPDGVWITELAGLSEGALVPQAVAGVLGVREQPGEPLTDTLVEALRDREILLVVDNCEHLVEAAAELVDVLLTSCPTLRVLATSREGLDIEGEVRWPVPPLSVPDAQRPPTVEDLEGSESARLFAERASERRPDFALLPENAQAVAEICGKLDGIPLAIELAAARMGTLSAEQISQRLEDSLKLLTGGGRIRTPRQRTLRGALEWSHELLSAPERVLLHRLSVFAGGWTIEAAEEVCAGEGIEKDEVLDLLTHLVDKSLVLVSEQRQGGEEARYRLLETVRQYAGEKLIGSGEKRGVGRRHGSFFAALGARAELALFGSEEGTWRGRLAAEHDNIRAALAWGEEHDSELMLRLAGALWRFWWICLTEGRAWLERALVAGGSDAPAPLRVKALGSASIVASMQGEAGRSRELAREAVALAEHSGDRAGRVWGLLMLSFAERCCGDHEAAAAHAEAAVEEARALDEDDLPPFLRALLLNRLGHEAYELRDWSRAGAVLEDALERWRLLGNPWGISVVLGKLADVAQGRGDDTRAATLYRESLELWRGQGNELGTVEILTGLARLAAKNQPERAVRLLAATQAIQTRVGLTPAPALRDKNERALASARRALGEEAFFAAWAAGEGLSLERAVAEAQTVTVDAGRAPPAAASDLLSPRELEVLKLVAQGMTNAQVAQELFISPRTVNAHLNSIYHKLEVPSRSAATRFAVEHGLL